MRLKGRVVDCEVTTLRLRLFIAKKQVQICVCFLLVGLWIGRGGLGFLDWAVIKCATTSEGRRKLH